jgi:glycosyltransferase involved in cell wall biosynthesis
MTIAAIIPALNEEISIGSMVLKTKKYVDRVIVVDDGSTDNTTEVATLAGAEVIRHTMNMGKGEALRTGFLAAGKNGVKIIVTIDADGQHNPDEIPKIIKPILSRNVEMVIGSRYLNGNNIPLYRRIGQKVLDKATNVNSGINVSDTQSGFRAFAIQAIPSFKFRRRGFSIESEMLTDAADAGLKIEEVNIGVRYDVDCSTENPVSHGFKVLANILRDMEFNRPLYYFTFPGMIVCIFGLYIGLTFLQSFYNGGTLYFVPILLTMFLTLFGLFISFTGVILHYVSRLHKKDIQDLKQVRKF